MGSVRWNCDPLRLAPDLRAWCEGLAALPFPVVVASGARSDAEQAVLYSWGRTVRNPDMDRTGDPGPNGLGVYATNARDTSNTAHGIKADGYAHAVDVDPVPATAGQYAAIGAAAEGAGFAWGGRFNVSGKPDVRHVETKRWRSVGTGAAVVAASGVSLGLMALALLGVLGARLKG